MRICNHLDGVICQLRKSNKIFEQILCKDELFALAIIDDSLSRLVSAR